MVHYRIGEHNTSMNYYIATKNAMEKWGGSSKTQGKAGNSTARTQQRQLSMIFLCLYTNIGYETWLRG